MKNNTKNIELIANAVTSIICGRAYQNAEDEAIAGIAIYLKTPSAEEIAHELFHNGTPLESDANFDGVTDTFIGDEELIRDGLRALSRVSHERARASGWYTDVKTGEPLVRNVPEMMMLQVSEIAEAMEGYRKDLPDDKLPHRPMVEVEMADCLIRIGDMIGYLGLDLGQAAIEKLAFNQNRADHKLENRAKDGGKKF